MKVKLKNSPMESRGGILNEFTLIVEPFLGL